LEHKGPYLVKDLKGMNPGQQVFGKYLLLDKVHRKTKDGKDMYNIKLGDASGDIDGVVWENCPIAGTFVTGSVLGLLGDVSSFNGKIQLTAKRIKVLEEDPSEYMPGPLVSLRTLKARFESHIESIKDRFLKELLDRIFETERKAVFCRAAAAKTIHHNYTGGLLEHTVEVADLCNYAAATFPMINRDLVICGALLHDIGKLTELDFKVVPQYTVEGRLVGHIVLGAEKVSEAIRAMRMDGWEFPNELEWMLKHMLLSHHGSLEFGSPIIPLFPEALLLHMMDNLDAKMYVFCNKLNETGSENEFFTNYDSFFAQHFYRFRYDESQAEEA